MPKRTIYRDRLTGRFAKRSSWTRSKAQGGNRYVRQTITVPPPPPPRDVYEFIVSLSYKGGRSFDVIVTASDEAEAFTVAREFLSKDVQGQRIVKAGFTGWQTDVAKGVRSDEEAGEAEYRSKSHK